MDYVHVQSLAWAKFEALRSHPPSSWSEGEVAQFHEIIAALEEAYAADLASFRIPKAEMKRRIVGASRRGLSGRQRPPQMSRELYCDEQFVQRQMDGVVRYFQNLEPAPERHNVGF
jgi:hypothetical protein